MDLDYRHNYDGTPDEVAALLLNEDFVKDVADHAGATEYDVSVEGQVTRLRMKLPAPSAVRSLAETVEMTQTFTVQPADADGARTVKVDVAVAKLPVSVDAQGVLRPQGDDKCEGHYTGVLKVKIPVVGKTIEKQAKPFIDSAFGGIHRRAQDWLTRD